MSLKIVNEVESIITPYLTSKGLRVYDVVFVKEAGDKILRVFVDKKDGFVSIDDCDEVSRWLSDELDSKDLIKEAYILEVSSPGIERQLKYDWHFEESIGKKVAVKLYKKVDDSKLIIGELISGSQKGDLKLDLNGEEIVIENENIIDVRIHFEFGGN